MNGLPQPPPFASPFGKQSSYFEFRLRLVPWEASLNLNFQDLHLGNGFAAVCTRDQLSIFVSGEPEANERLRGAASSLGQMLVRAHGYCSYPGGGVLDVEPMTWLEIQDSRPKRTISGYMHESLGYVGVQPDHPDNTPLRGAASLLPVIAGHGALNLALADFHSARRERSPYLAFFAFRTLEDVGYHYGVKGDKPDWAAMNKALGTTESHWQLLTKAGQAARHLKPGMLATIAEQERKDWLDLAHDAVRRTIRHLGINLPGVPA